MRGVESGFACDAKQGPISISLHLLGPLPLPDSTTHYNKNYKLGDLEEYAVVALEDSYMWS